MRWHHFTFHWLHIISTKFSTISNVSSFSIGIRFLLFPCLYRRRIYKSKSCPSMQVPIGRKYHKTNRHVSHFIMFLRYFCVSGDGGESGAVPYRCTHMQRLIEDGAQMSKLVDVQNKCHITGPDLEGWCGLHSTYQVK